jgi:hypothetical protein
MIPNLSAGDRVQLAGPMTISAIELPIGCISRAIPAAPA